MKQIFFIIIFTLFILTGSEAQVQSNNVTDTSIVFQPSQPLISAESDEIKKIWGVDIIMSSDGFGLGTFYGFHFSDQLIGKINFSISESKDEREFEIYNPYTGDIFVPNKINRFLVMPLFFAAEYRLFKDEIMDNFRPYISAAAGPALIFSSPYNKEFFSSLKYGKAHYTLGGYIGAGAFFGSDLLRVFGLNVRYYFIQYPTGIESMLNVKKKDFGEFSLSASIGMGW